MIRVRLNDAAIALHQALSRANIKYGIFGGYAIGVLGGARESKDINCLASMSKAGAIDLLDGKHNFKVVPQVRDDYVAFIWSDLPKMANAVLVEIFFDQFEGDHFNMDNVQIATRYVYGETLGTKSIALLDPFHIFKGKIHAAATRAKFHDSADLRWLEGCYQTYFQQRRAELRLCEVGLAIKRYPELEYVFLRLGVDVIAAESSAASLSLIIPPQKGDVQEGLLRGAENC